MTDETRNEALKWATECIPSESCGLVIIEKGREVFVRCKNLSPFKDAFYICPEDYAKAEDRGEVVRIVHSHCYSSARPSEADLVSCELMKLPWSIVSVPNGDWYDFLPSGYQAPLIGRQWLHGQLDCYSLIRDYYRQKLGVELLDFDRDFEWWLHGENLYLDNFKKAGFVEVPVSEIREHDVILMRISSPVINHGAVYLGNELMLHHLHRRLSTRDVYGGYYLKMTCKVVRYANS